MQNIDIEDLIEAKRDTVVITWGRFNPPTTGHQKLIEKVAREAKKRAADYRIFPTKSFDPEKNPLTFKEKVRFMKMMFPQHAKNISSSESINTLILAASQMSKKGYSNFVLVVGSDRVQEFKSLLTKYNGSDDYNFDKIEIVSAGERDPDATDVTGMSASKMREAAAANNFAEFKKGVPKASVAKKLYDAVRRGMRVNEIFVRDGIFDYVDALNEGVVSKRFDRLLRFGLSDGGSGDIPLTKRAFKDFENAETNPVLRKKVFSTVDRVFDYLLTDDLLYNRFLVLLHREYVFGEETRGTMRFNQFYNTLKEAEQTAPLSTTPRSDELNFVVRFANREATAAFLNDIEPLRLIDVSWVSDDELEIQFYVIQSTAGQEAPRSASNPKYDADRMNRYAGHDTNQFGSETRVIDLIMKHGGKLNRFVGDVREGQELVLKTKLIENLVAKSNRSGIGYDIVCEVYVRGAKDWDPESDLSQEQWAFNRVNSFVSGGKAREVDHDLWEEHLDRESWPSSPLDYAFLEEASKLTKAIGTAAIGYALWKKMKGEKPSDKKDVSKLPDVLTPNKSRKKRGSWRDEIDWDKNESVDFKFEDFLSEEGGAGDFGTDEIRINYAKMTPGQDPMEEDLSQAVSDENRRRAEQLKKNHQIHMKKLARIRATERERQQKSIARKSKSLARQRKEV